MCIYYKNNNNINIKNEMRLVNGVCEIRNNNEYTMIIYMYHFMYDFR